MPYATHESEDHFGVIGHERYSDDMDLCDLLQTMKLDSAYEKGKTAENVVHIVSPQPPPTKVQDDHMSEDPSYQSDAVSECSASSSTNHERSYGCAYLQSIRSQFEDYPTTGGEYLDAIFTHREILYSYPAMHQECARGFSDLAYLLEKRAWRADREADMEAVSSFRHEAWVIASSFATPTASKPKDPLQNMGHPAYVCVMPMM